MDRLCVSLESPTIFETGACAVGCGAAFSTFASLPPAAVTPVVVPLPLTGDGPALPVWEATASSGRRGGRGGIAATRGFGAGTGGLSLDLTVGRSSIAVQFTIPSVTDRTCEHR